MKKKKSFDLWQINNKEYLVTIYKIIINRLEDKKIVLNEKKNLYKDLVLFLYKNVL